VGKKTLISLAVVTAALVASVPMAELSRAHAVSASALIQPLSNGNGGGP
jgi:hypothetical protein